MKYTDKKIGISTFIFLLLCAIIISSLSTYFILNSKLESSSKTISEKELLVSKLVKSDDLLSKRYIGDMPANSVLVDGLLSGYINSLNDRYALYMTKENYRAYNAVSAGIINMLGIISSFDGAVDGILVDFVMSGSPASKKGIQKGDIITKVGGIAVTKNNYYVLLNSLMGKDGSEADIRINRKGEMIDLTVKLSLTSFDTVASYFFDELGVGVININFFSEKTFAEFESCLKGITEKGPAGLIIDIRGNAGGDINVAAKVLDRILPAGTILTEKASKNDLQEAVSSSGDAKVFSSDEISIDMPIVLLTDEYTKGAAEIFAASLKSFNVAVVGSHTFGKTALQDVINLGDETAIMFSAVKYMNSKGEEISGPVEPTEAVELAENLKIKLPDLDSNEDTQLKQALTHFHAAGDASSSSSQVQS